MREIGFAIIAALAMTTAAQSQALDDGSFWQHRPSRAILEKYWPHDAEGRLIYGEVNLDCQVGADGSATNCKIASATPNDPNISKAALNLAPLFNAPNRDLPHTLIDIDLLSDTAADWLHKPSADQLAIAWPRVAVIQGIQGAAVRLKCQVNKQGLAQGCQTLSEDPPGWGFDEAAIQLTPTFLLKPALRGGEPVVSDVVLPITFGFGPQPTRFTYPPPASKTALARDLGWAKTPVPADILKLLDKKVGDKFADGRVVLKCDLDETAGNLVRCGVVNASSGMKEFANVAQTLAGEFQVKPETLAAVRAAFDAEKIKPVVFLPFSFPDMTSPAHALPQPRAVDPYSRPASRPSPLPGGCRQGWCQGGSGGSRLRRVR